MERHRRDLEAQAGEQEHEAEGERQAALPRGFRNAGEAHRSGRAIDQRGAVQEHAGRERAKDKIFQSRLGRAQTLAVDRGDHVKRETHQLETEIERDEVPCRNQHEHAGGREHDQDRILEAPPLRLPHELARQDDGGGRSDKSEELEEAGIVVDDEAAAEGRGPARRHQRDEHARGDEQKHRRAAHEAGRLVAAIRPDDEEDQRAKRENDLGQRRSEGGQIE